MYVEGKQHFEDLSNILSNEFDKHNNKFPPSNKVLISSKVQPLNSENTGKGFYYVVQKYVYYGDIVKGIPEGQGVIVFIDHYFYKGNFKSGKMNG